VIHSSGMSEEWETDRLGGLPLLLVEVTGFEPVAPTVRAYPTVYGSPWCVWVS
jgi:hypothetical protein